MGPEVETRAAAPDLDTRLEEFVQDAGRCLSAGNLDIIVGAGASIASGLPSWDGMIKQLVGQYLARKYQSLRLSREDLGRMAEIFVNDLGREAAVDLVKQGSESETYYEFLRDSLYSKGPFDLATIHYELAALVLKAAADTKTAQIVANRIVTFNFDNLLKRALEQLAGKPVSIETTGERHHGLHVRHLHGYLPPDGARQGNIILSERDYHESAGNESADNRLKTVMQDSSKTVLLIGLSLTDPRLRRILLDRSWRRKKGEQISRAYVLLSERQAKQDAPLVDRLARQFLQEHAQDFWSSWEDLTVIPVKSHSLIPYWLRQIRLGTDAVVWVKKGLEFLTRESSVYKNIFEPDKQRKAVQLLAVIHERIRQRFGVGPQEMLRLGCFVPWAEDGNGTVSLRLACHFSGGEGGGGDAQPLTRASSSSIQLDVSSLKRPEGAAGTSYLRGHTVEAGPDSQELDINFDAEKKREWNERRYFTSLMCVPVYDSPEWIPIGVSYINSNQRRPFWRDLGLSDYVELEALIRTLYQRVLYYESVLDNPSPGLPRETKPGRKVKKRPVAAETARRRRPKG